ncbi:MULTISPECIES: DNA-binding protein [Peribacillus]|uniref:DNA-binding protein n=1 Tax=Peribacillus TaxID=2675229 RepID=UPI001EFC4E56|nr:DNA-binding protein [Peribacillus frigoritolerans]MCM3168995.1 DNA-binding protein [Peribacillus frigoritolerans]ULM98786.1 DNA-binding protein [Peribacillus frigoritolerans]
MIQVNLDFADENFREVLRQEIKNAMADVVQQNQLPPMLTRKQLMQLFNIGETKTSELLSRPDFPVFREAGVLIPTHLLFKWIELNTRFVDENTSYFKKEVV